MDFGDTARIHGGWASDPDVIALCSKAECPAAGDRIAIGHDAEGRYVASWSGGEIRLHIQCDRDLSEYVTREGVEGIVHRVWPVRPIPRFEAYIVSVHVGPDHNPAAVRTYRQPDPVIERPDDEPVRNDF